MAYIQRQGEIQRNIESALANFKKDGAERKSKIEYFKARLDTLNILWGEFQFNHEQICMVASRTDPYFTNRIFESTKEVYLTFNSKLVEGFKKLSEEPYEPRVEAGTSELKQMENLGSETEERKDDTALPPQPIQADHNQQRQKERGLESKMDEMLRKQAANMKAFVRTVNNIDIELLTDKWELEDALKSLGARWSVVDSLHWEIESEGTQLNTTYEGTFNQHEKTYNMLKKNINKKIWSVAHREKSTPVLDIPTFHGNYNAWVSFKDLFNEAIHNNTALSNAQKMQFLKAKVKGEAERLIQHLSISSDNYLVCWEILNNRYNNTKLIFTSHMNILFGLPNMQQQSIAQIKKMHDTATECLHAIKNLGVDITTWDPIIVHILTQKLDTETHKDYIESLRSSRELPILQEFFDFLEGKFTSLESSRRKQEPANSKTYPQQTSNSNYVKKPGQTYNNRPYYNNNLNINGTSKNNGNITIAKTMHVANIKCPLCKNPHGIYRCRQFLQMPVEKRHSTVNKLALCINCLFSHHGNACNSNKTCQKCAGQHNTLLHEACVQSAALAQSSTSTHTSNAAITKKHLEHVSHTSQIFNSEILLATAQLKVKALDGTYHFLRALIDQGSQISLITEQAAQLLNLKREKCKGVIYGVGQKENNCKGKLNITCSSIYNDFTFNAEVIIMNNLIKSLPNKTFAKPTWSMIQNINLADPDFNISRPVDLLLGADIYSLILLSGMIKGEDSSQPMAQQTHLGWLLCGNAQTYHCNVVINNLEEIQQFWQVEDITEDEDLSRDDLECIQHFEVNTTRNIDGRYEVRLPMKPNFEQKLGESKTKAIAQFRHLEKKFERQQKLAEAYKAFMKEYSDLGHMKPTRDSQEIECYLPHHGVVREESTSTKYRVVFNASSKNSKGYSLNDLMYTGPNLQHDLQTLLLKWRQYEFAFSADIEKMYRQILVHEEDQVLQKIIWREDNGPLQSFLLTTVSFGTKPAPFLAMMTLRKLASDERHRYPEAAKVLEESFYMDDLVHGAHSVEQAKTLIADLIAILKSGGFNLRKWSTNREEVLVNIQNKSNNENLLVNFKQNNISKTLGLCWNPEEDTFIFQCKITKQKGIPTKRTLLSEISKLFDPLGWLAPLSTKLKILFQKVWEQNINWDEQITQEIYTEWSQIQEDIHVINDCKIRRWLSCKQNDVIQLHGFCDASLAAYACAIYARINSQTEPILVAAKTKLVPHKKQLTLPKLELCGAHLLSKLMAKVRTSLQLCNIQTFGWTDSKIVLGWLQGEPSRWKTFVANRVEQITQVIPETQWRYVKSAENPADAASRGQTASQLKENSLWWTGPTWLTTFQPGLEKSEKQKFITCEEQKKSYKSNVIQNNNNQHFIIKLLEKHSSITKVIRIMAYILRALTPRRRGLPTYLTLPELQRAKLIIIKHVQNCELGTDIDYLRRQNKVDSSSVLFKLRPFIDSDNILRIGGRLREAHLSYDMKHPIIIPKDSRLTTLLIDQAHQLTLHGGAKLTLNKLREEYWIIGGNNRVKKQVGNCVKCLKIDGKTQQQLMGDLPAARVNEAKPFYHTGVDYTGFVTLRASKGRGSSTLKGYIVIFICMVTKAVHLDLVTDLTSSAFLAALQRMSARKGAPHHLYSDNGTNFRGSDNKLKQQWQELQKIFTDSFMTEVAEMKIQWHFTAPSWPSSGGLWERGVRSLKGHLKRVVGEQKLTYEEYSTVLAQLEACLNSRPLCPLKENIDDLDALTPAHFFPGRAGLTIIETEEDARTRWHLTQKIFRDIWKRWKAEYLTQMTARQKWNKPQKNLEVGDLVVIHEDNLPAGKWAMGRVLEVHPGKDGLVRVVTLKTKNGVMQRPVVKLSVLPLAKQEEQRKQVDASKQIKTQKPKQKRGCFATIITMLVYFLTYLTAGSCVKMTPINDRQGFYLDKLGNMELVRDDWKLVAYYDMSPYWEGVSAYKKYNDQLDYICKQITALSHCDVVMLQLRHTYDELQHYNNILLRNQLKQQTRRRRGLINGVGYLANSLFGVLDDRFAEQYQKDISLLRDNEKHLVTMWKNQTSIVEAEYNMLLRTRETIQKQHKLIHQHLLNLEKDTSVMAKEITAAECLSQFTIISMAANNLLNHLKTIQDTLIDTLTNIYNEKMNIHIMSPQQLQRELSIISSQLTNDLTLPIDNIQTNLYNIYQVLKVKARITDLYMLFEIRIPLITRDRYDLYRIIPVPHSSAKNMISVVPTEKHIAINLQKDAFMPLQEQDLENCVLRDTFIYMCYLKVPIYKMNNDKDLCIKDETENHKCKTSIAACQNMWISLSKPNHYLYFCCDNCQLRTICKDRVTAQSVTRTNIIYIEENCIVKTDNFAVYTHMNMESKLNLKNNDILTPEIEPINHIINITMHEFGNYNLTLPNENKEQRNIEQKLKVLKETQSPIDQYSVHDVHHYTAIYCLWAAMITVVLVLVCRKRCRLRLKRLSPPTPTSTEDTSAPSAYGVPASRGVERQAPAPVRATPAPRAGRFISMQDIGDSDQCRISAQNILRSASENQVNSARVEALELQEKPRRSQKTDRASSPIS